MRVSRQTIRKVLPHVLIWVGFAIYEQITLLIVNPWKFALFPVILNYLLNALFFYGNSDVLLPRFYTQRRQLANHWAYGVAALLLLTAYGFLRMGLYNNLIPAIGVPAVPVMGSTWQFWLLSAYRGSFFFFVSIGYWFARRAVALEVQKRQHEHQLRTAERSLLVANLSFLKNQINPHFLFNTLNSLYAQVALLSEPAAKGILLLSDTMRYALTEEYNGKVMLMQEVQHLRNYFALNQMRFHNQLQIDFETSGNLQFSLILPLVLITFVENCFKHGELGEAADPLVIRLAVVRNQLTFHTRNKKRRGPKEKSTGIGLANTRQRLDLAYPDRYALAVDDGPTHYTCTLTIDL